MFLWFFIAVGVIALYIHKQPIKDLALIVYYEAIYWLLGGCAMFEDLVFSVTNKIKELPNRVDDVAVVTGGSRGIGLEVVRKLLQCNMHVIIGCRNVEAGLNAIAKLRKEGVTGGKADVKELDTSSLRSVTQFANEVLSKISQLHILINNAGIMFVPFSLTEDGFETHLGVNYMGHVMLIHHLLPLMKETGRLSNRYSRIIHVSSCAHVPGSINFDDINFIRTLYIPSEAYAQSKLAQLMFSNALERKLEAEGAKVSSIAVHPGIVNTELFDGTLLKRIAPWMPKLLFKTPEQGSRTIVYASLSRDLEGRGGIYLSNCRETWTSYTASNIEKQNKLMDETMKMLNVQDFGRAQI